MNKKKLVIFMPIIDPGGGVEKNFFLITNFLASKNLRITVITNSNWSKRKLNKNIKFVSPSFQIPKFIGRRIKFIISCYYLLKEIFYNKEITVLCFQGIIYCAIVCKLFSTKFIIRSNSSPSGWSKNFFKKYMYKKIYGFANKIIVNSLQFKAELKKKYKLNSICIYNPLNKTEIISKSKKNIKFNFFKKNTLNIISVARLTEQKDHLSIINAIDILKKKYNIKLLILGSGPDYNKIINQINKLKLNKFIKILKYKNNPFPYINYSDMFILSSNYEGLPNVLIESVVLKKIVISSDCPTGPREILDNGKGGTLFEIGNINQLANKISLYIKNKTPYYKKSEFAYKRLSRFDFKKRLNDYFKIICCELLN